MPKRNGLALLLALLAMSACLGLTFLLVGLGRTESAATSMLAAQARLRAAAQGAALRGLAGLQSSAGPDVAFTYHDVSAGVRIGRGPSVWVPDGEAELEGLRWRWSVEDLSLSYDLAARPMASRQASAWAKSLAGRPKLPLALSAEPTAAQVRALEVGGAELYAASGGEHLRPGHTWQVRGLLTDAAHGGWRRDLSRQAVMAGVKESEAEPEVTQHRHRRKTPLRRDDRT